MLSRRGSNEALNKNPLMTNQTFNIVIKKLPGEDDYPRASHDRINSGEESDRVVRI